MSKQHDEKAAGKIAFDEVEAMRRIAVAIGGLSEESCLRVLDWAADHFANGVLFQNVAGLKASSRSKVARSRDFSIGEDPKGKKP